MALRATGIDGGAAAGGRRVPIAVLAWLGATAVASGVAWLGVDSVLIPAAETPPAVLAVGAQTSLAPALTPAPPSSAAPTPSPSPVASGSAPVHVGFVKSPSASGSASVSASATPSPTSSLSRYETAGGTVVLAISAHFVSLVSATPAAGYSVQNWSATGWLRVDFSQGSTTYSIFATWNGYSPQVQVVSPSATS